MSDKELFTSETDEQLNPAEDNFDNGESVQQKRRALKSDDKMTGKETFSKTRTIVGVCLIIAAVVLAIILVPILSGQNVTYNILYAKVDIPAGIEITESNLNTYFGVLNTPDANMYKAGIPAEQARARLIGTFTRREIYSGKHVTSNDFSQINLIYNDRVPDGYTLIAMNVPSVVGYVGYLPQVGDIITMYRFVAYEENPSDMKFDIDDNNAYIGTPVPGTNAEPYEYLQFVEIYAALDKTLNDVTQTGGAEVILILKVKKGTAQEAQALEVAASGNYTFTLVSSGDAARKQAYLEFQDRIIEEGASGAGRKEYIFKLSDFAINGYFPELGDTIRIAHTFAHDSYTSVDYDPILKYIAITDVYNKNGVSIGLTSNIDTDILSTGSIGLYLTEEQAASLQKYIADGKVFIKPVKEEDFDIACGFDTVNRLIWKERESHIMDHIQLPSEDTTPETNN